MKYIVVPFILGFIVLQNCTLADETTWAKFLTLQHISLGLDVNDDGTMYLTRRNIEGFHVARFNAIEFFRHPSLLKELALPLAKERRLLELCEEWETKQGDARKQSGLDAKIKADELDGKNAENNYLIWQKQVEDLLKRQVKLTAEFDEEIAKLIGVKSHKRLRQIQLRYVLRLKGIVRILKSESSREMIGISSDPTQVIRKISPGIVETTKREINETVAAAHRDWLKYLNDDSRNVYYGKWGPALNGSTSVDQLKWQLGYRDQDRIQVDPDLEEFSKVLGSAVLNFDVSSEVYSASPNLQEMAKQSKNYRRFHAYREIFYFYRPNTNRDFELLASQHQQIRDIDKRYDRQVSRQISQLSLKYNASPALMEHKSGPWTDELEQLKEEAYQTAVEEFEKVILPHQRKLIGEVALNAETRRLGPLADMLDGKLGENMKLSDRHKEILAEKARDVREFLDKESLRLENDMIQQVLDALPRNQSVALEKALGPPLKHSPPNISLMLLHLTMQARKE